MAFFTKGLSADITDMGKLKPFDRKAFETTDLVKTKTFQFNPFTAKGDFIDFTLSNARRLGDPLGSKGFMIFCDEHNWQLFEIILKNIFSSLSSSVVSPLYNRSFFLNFLIMWFAVNKIFFSFVTGTTLNNATQITNWVTSSHLFELSPQISCSISVSQFSYLPQSTRYFVQPHPIIVKY